MTGYWSQRSDEVLSGVFGCLSRDLDQQEVRRRVREAYPFGARSHWPYKVWLQRVRAWVCAWRQGLMTPPPPGVKRRDLAARDRETLELFDAAMAELPAPFPVPRTFAYRDDVLVDVGPQPHRFAGACL